MATPIGNGAPAGGGGGDGFLSRLFGGGEQARRQKRAEAGTMIKPRKAPVKVEPKVFFANERTFLAWMHLSVMLAGASIAILAFAEDQNPLSQIYGVILLPVAIAFIVHAMYQCTFLLSLYFIFHTARCACRDLTAFCKFRSFMSNVLIFFPPPLCPPSIPSTDARRAYMIRNRMPGPYDDTTAPTVLGMMLMLSILAQFTLKVYSMKNL